MSDLRGCLDAQTVVVLGAGGLDYLRPRALRGLPVISVNSSARAWGLTPEYVVVKEHAEEAIPNAAAFPDVPIICSRGTYGGNAETADLPANVVLFDHRPNLAERFDVASEWPTDPDALVVSMSTITTAMHFAAWAGASVIFVVGLIPGRLEGRTHFADYGAQPEWMPDWLAQTERQALAVKRELIRRYDVDILGLFPWIGPDLDGLRYVGASNRINAW